jgi:HlyD family secretion protein
MIMIRRILIGVVALLVVAAAAWALWPRPLAVETATIGRGAIDVTVEDEGISRIRDVFTVSAPISGKLMRLDLQPGDTVTAGQTVVATIEPTEPGLLDVRSRAIAESNVSAAQSGVDQAAAQLQQAQAQLDFAQNELKRSESLAGRGIIPEQAYQRSALNVSVAQTGLDAVKASLVVRQRELESARAALIQGQGGGDPNGIVVHAPASGDVLAIMTQSEQVVAAGTPLLTVGDPSNLEVAVDLLSRDAVAVDPGDPATIENWGGPTLKAVVERVNPAAVTKVSALGIEEQRVTVVLKVVDGGPERARLGHGFRVVARIVVWHGDSLVVVPMGALFRQGQDWAVFTVDKGVAHLRKILLGHQNTNAAEVESGLEPGEVVVLHPGDRVSDGTSVTVGNSGPA